MSLVGGAVSDFVRFTSLLAGVKIETPGDGSILGGGPTLLTGGTGESLLSSLLNGEKAVEGEASSDLS